MQRSQIGKALKDARRNSGEALRCDACGYTPPNEFAERLLEVHHIERVADGGEHSDENLVLLCNNCHRMAHCLFPCVGGYRKVPARGKLLAALAAPDAFLARSREEAMEKIDILRSSLPLRIPDGEPSASLLTSREDEGDK
jgi:HNH endonuclease